MTSQTKKTRVLPRNWNKILQGECDCTQTTVTNAIRYNQDGHKCEAVRKKFDELWGTM